MYYRLEVGVRTSTGCPPSRMKVLCSKKVSTLSSIDTPLVVVGFCRRNCIDFDCQCSDSTDLNKLIAEPPFENPGPSRQSSCFKDDDAVMQRSTQCDDSNRPDEYICIRAHEPIEGTILQSIIQFNQTPTFTGVSGGRRSHT